MLAVADVMTRTPVMLGPEAAVTEALHAMRARGISSVLVVPPPGSGDYGIVTMRDIVGKVVKDDLDPDAVRLGDIMTWRLVTASPTWPLQQAAQVMTEARVRRLPVVEGPRLLGLISDTDLFIALVPQREWEDVRVIRRERAWRRATAAAPVRTVRDLMSAPVLTIGAAAPVKEAVRKMVAGGVASLLVSEAEAGSAAGIMTKRDVVTKIVAHGKDPLRVAVAEIMTYPVRTVEPAATIEACSARMAAEGVRRYPVVQRSEIIGIISDSDILAAAAAHRWRGQRGRRWPTSYIVADVMSPPPAELTQWMEAVPPELSLWDCAARLARSGVRQLPVIQQGRIIGVVSDTDILRALEERGGAH